MLRNGEWHKYPLRSSLARIKHFTHENTGHLSSRVKSATLPCGIYVNISVDLVHVLTIFLFNSELNRSHHIPRSFGEPSYGPPPQYVSSDSFDRQGKFPDNWLRTTGGSKRCRFWQVDSKSMLVADRLLYHRTPHHIVRHRSDTLDRQ